MLWKSRSRPLLALRFAPLSSPHLLILLPNFLPCFPSFPLVTCRRHSPYLAPCATSTRYCTISHRHDSPSATPPSALYIQPMYLLYLVRFELVGYTPALHISHSLLSESDPSLLCLCALVLRQRPTTNMPSTRLVVHFPGQPIPSEVCPHPATFRDELNKAINMNAVESMEPPQADRIVY